jgi:hypothetical protein
MRSVCQEQTSATKRTQGLAVKRSILSRLNGGREDVAEKLDAG